MKLVDPSGAMLNFDLSPESIQILTKLGLVSRVNPDPDFPSLCMYHGYNY